MKSFGKTHLRMTLISLISLSVMAACSFSSSGSSSSDKPKDASGAKAILKNLGVDEVASPPDLVTTSTNGEPITIENPDTWTPLKHTYAVFNPTAEVCQIGIPNGDYFNAIFGDGKNDTYTSTVPLKGDQAWESGCAKRSCSADLDGDGIDEIVVLYTPTNGGTSLNLTVYSSQSQSFTTSVTTGLTVSDKLNTWNNLSVTASAHFDFNGGATNIVSAYFSLTPADINGDGREEILFHDYETLHVLSVNVGGDSVSELESFVYSGPISDVAAGDCDGDGKDEFLVSVQGYGCQLYDSTLTSPVFNTGFLKSESTAYMHEVGFGDFDGDNIDEIVIVGDTPSTCQARFYEYSSSKGLTEKQVIHSEGIGSLHDFKAFPRAVDIDGDGKDEVFLFGYICRDVLTSPNTSVYVADRYAGFYGMDEVQVGDVDGDGREDVVFLGKKSNSGYRSHIGAFGVDSTGVWNNIAIKNTYVPSDTTPVATSFDAQFAAVTMAVGNFDFDSARVKYAGHKLEFTNPVIISVLASPPYFSDIQQNEDSYSPGEWTTRFGTSSGSSTGNAASVGMSIGVSVEAEQEASIFGVKIAQFKMSAAYSVATTSEFSSSMSITKSVSYSCSGGEDRVIFTSIPIDVYSYTVLESPVSSDEGKTMTIEIPRDYSTYTVTKSFFNDNNGELTDIPGEILPHTIGNPGTYPDEADKTQMLTEYGGYASNDALAVGQYTPGGISSGGVTELEIEVEEDTATSISVDIGAEFSVGGGAGGVTVSANLGFNTGYNYTMSATSGTTFGGTIGNLPTSYFNNSSYTYSQGLFVYPYPDPNTKQKYWVVNYWVEK